MSKATTQDRLVVKTPEAAFLHVLRREFNFSPRVSRELLNTAQEMLVGGVPSAAVRPGQVLVGSNFLLELVPEAERSLYLGLSNTLMGVVVLVSGLGGLLVDLFGFAGPFVASLGLCLAGYVLTLRLPEPRETAG